MLCCCQGVSKTAQKLVDQPSHNNTSGSSANECPIVRCQQTLGTLYQSGRLKIPSISSNLYTFTICVQKKTKNHCSSFRILLQDSEPRLQKLRKLRHLSGRFPLSLKMSSLRLRNWSRLSRCASAMSADAEAPQGASHHGTTHIPSSPSAKLLKLAVDTRSRPVLDLLSFSKMGSFCLRLRICVKKVVPLGK